MSRHRSSRGDLPLFAWGEALRRAAAVRRRRRRLVAITGLGCGLLMFTVVVPMPPILLWNASASAPIGLYAIMPGNSGGKGDMVAARLPVAVRMLAATRHYLPLRVPLVKRIAAAQGDTVCALGQEIFVNGQWIAERFVRDPQGRPMPWWNGCRMLGTGELFLLMADKAGAFDGRYFGVTKPADVIGKARILWAR